MQTAIVIAIGFIGIVAACFAVPVAWRPVVSANIFAAKVRVAGC